ncbi:hypothetical protein Droror1_Dr00011916 [Drosera rotundifolia]
MAQNLYTNPMSAPLLSPTSHLSHLSSSHPKSIAAIIRPLKPPPSPAKLVVRCGENHVVRVMRTCRNCKQQFDVGFNHPRACRFHTAHFGGETKRKFESVHTGGTMSTPNSGQVFQYWHCCGSEDPFDPGCTSAPHSSYDDD